MGTEEGESLRTGTRLLLHESTFLVICKAFILQRKYVLAGGWVSSMDTNRPFAKGRVPLLNKIGKIVR
jgi:hypothetical protein